MTSFVVNWLILFTHQSSLLRLDPSSCPKKI